MWAFRARLADSPHDQAGQPLAPARASRSTNGRVEVGESSNEDRARIGITIPLLAGDGFVCNVFHNTGAA